jgi:carbohydrate-selective porin OprB
MKLIQSTALAIVSLAVLTTPLYAARDAAEANYYLSETPYLLGYRGGARTDFKNSGATFNVYNIFDVCDDFSGAIGNGAEVFDRQRVSAAFDLEHLLGWESTTFDVSGVAQYGKNYNRSRFGVLTNPRSIEGRETTRLATIWFGQTLLDGQLDYKIGKVDVVGAWGAQENGRTFMNDELAYVPNAIFGSGLPFDPAQKLGLIVTYRLRASIAGRRLYIKGGVFGSNNSNAYAEDHKGLDFSWRGPVAYAGEIGYRDPGAGKPCLVQFGGHYNTENFANLGGSEGFSDHNILVDPSAEKTFHYFDSDEKHPLNISLTWVNYPVNRNTYHNEFTAALQAQGPFASRSHDALGIGFIAAYLSDDYSASVLTSRGRSAREECIIEVAYKIATTRWLTLQPDF